MAAAKPAPRGVGGGKQRFMLENRDVAFLSVTTGTAAAPAAEPQLVLRRSVCDVVIAAGILLAELALVLVVAAAGQWTGELAVTSDQ